MTRTTVRLNEDVLREAKKLAAEQGTTLTALIEDSLRKELAQRAQPRKRKRTILPTFHGSGTWPGVRLLPFRASPQINRNRGLSAGIRRSILVAQNISIVFCSNV